MIKLSSLCLKRRIYSAKLFSKVLLNFFIQLRVFVAIIRMLLLVLLTSVGLLVALHAFCAIVLGVGRRLRMQIFRSSRARPMKIVIYHQKIG